MSAAMTGLCYLLRELIIRMFLTEPASFDFAITFTNILLTTSFLFDVFYVLTNALLALLYLRTSRRMMAPRAPCD